MGFSQSNRQVDSLMELMKAARKTDPDKAMGYAHDALQIAKQKNSDKAIELNYLVGMFYIQKGNYDSALNYFGENLKAGIKTSNQTFIAKASINMANIYVTQGKYNSALDRYLAALKITEAGSDKDLLYVNYLCLGITYYYLKNYSKSLEYYEKCLAMEKEKGESAKMAYTYNAMGIIYKESGNYDKALDLLNRTQKLALQSGDSAILSHNLGNLGELYGLKGDFDKGNELLKNGLAIQKQFHDDKGIGESLVNLGKLSLKFHKTNDAIAYYKEALELAERIGINDIKKDANKGLADAYAELKDFKTAMEYEKAFALVKDSLFNATSSMQIADMQTRYETEKKEQENTLLLKDNSIKSLEIGQQKNQRNMLLVVFGVLIVIGVLIYNSSRLKHRNKILAEKELRTLEVFQAQEKEKMHLSKELHDGLGPLLSLIKLNVSAIKVEQADEKLLSEVKELTSESIKEVRNISHALAPSLLQKQGLQAALEEFVGQVNSSGIVFAELQYHVSKKLSPETEINLYRIAQEAINNTIKHAGASNAAISMKEKSPYLEVVITDNGKGFSSEKNNGNGLNNIYTRVDFLKGTISMNSKKEKGTEFVILIPLS